MRRYSFAIALALSACSIVFGQTSRGAVLQPGYRIGDNPITVAPLQILNLPVLGLEISASQMGVVRRDTEGHYPYESDGVRITVRGQTAAAEWPASIVQLNRQTCTQTTTSCEPVASVTALLPEELQTLAGGAATLSVWKHNAQIASVPLRVISDQLRILNSCDDVGLAPSLFGQVPTSECAYAITHVSGFRVTPEDPAVPGETLIVWVSGAGSPDPESASSRALKLRYTPQFTFHYGVNAPPVMAPFANAGAAAPALSAATFRDFPQTQINLVLPASGRNLNIPACNPAEGIRTNLTISVTGLASSDGAGICIRP